MSTPAAPPVAPAATPNRFLTFGRTARRVPDLEEGQRLPTILAGAFAIWLVGVGAFASATGQEGGVGVAQWVFYLALGPWLGFGWTVARRTGMMFGLFPLVIVLWVTLLGVFSDFYMASGSLIAVVLTATFLTWMGTEVAPQFVGATVCGVLTAGLAQGDEFLADRMIVVGLALCFVVFVVGRQSNVGIAAMADREKLIERLAQESRTDPLAQIGNRLFLTEKLRQLASCPAALDQRHQLALAIIDLNDFKAINDAHGHLIGDEVLIEVASRLENIEIEGSTPARIGGDEFALLIEQPTGTPDEISRQVEEALAWTWLHHDDHVEISSSVGVAVAEVAQAEFEAMYLTADLALYQRKAEHKGDRRLSGRRTNTPASSQ